MELLQRLRHSTFLRHNLIFFIGSVGVGVLNYLYYPILGRLMEPAAFGEVQALVSLFLQFTIFLNVLSMVTVNVVTNYSNRGKLNQVVYELEKIASWLAVGILLLSVIFGNFLKELLQFESVAPFGALALALAVSVPLTFRSAYIRGERKFGAASTAMAVGAAAKIVCSVALVAFGLGTVGAILGIVAAQIIALIYATVWAARVGFRKPEYAKYLRKPKMQAILPELRYAAAVLGGSLAITLLMSIDILIVKHYFDARTAGLYAGVATVARIIFFFTASISQVLMPSVKLSNTAAQNRALLLKSLVMLVGVGGSVLLVCVAFPQFITRTLMGNEYTEFVDLLPLLALTMFIISLLNLLLSYLLAMRRKMVAFIGIMGFVVTFAALIVHHDSLRAVVGTVLMGSVITMCLLVIYSFIINSRPHRREVERGTNGSAAYFDNRSDLQ